MSDERTIREALIDFLDEEMGVERVHLEGDAPLFSGGLLASLEALRVLVFLERRFGVRVSPLEVGLDSFDSVTRLTQFVLRHGTAP